MKTSIVPIYPKKLRAGDEVRVIAPAKSFKPSFNEEKKLLAIKRLEIIGLKVSFGKYISEINEFESTTIEHRIEDLHDAFADKNVKAILTVLGGSTSNQLLKYIDYDLIKNNPKILCGLSDITALANAVYHKTGLVTYSGPHFTIFGASNVIEYTMDYFKKCLFFDKSFEVESSQNFCDKRWDTKENKNEGYWIINQGKAQEKSIGGNLLTFKYLQGTDFSPDLNESILFIEDNEKENFRAFENQLQSLINQPNFNGVKGIVIGRFQKGSGMTKDLLMAIVKTKKELDNMPVIANADFGHTTPMITFPIGGGVEMSVSNEVVLKIVNH